MSCCLHLSRLTPKGGLLSELDHVTFRVWPRLAGTWCSSGQKETLAAKCVARPKSSRRSTSLLPARIWSDVQSLRWGGSCQLCGGGNVPSGGVGVGGAFKANRRPGPALTAAALALRIFSVVVPKQWIGFVLICNSSKVLPGALMLFAKFQPSALPMQNSR